jgi:ABC-type phosphate transport system substrate-binding protein
VARLRLTACSLLLATLWLGLSGASSSVPSAVQFQMIVHPSNPAVTVSREFVRDAFLKKVVRWGHGEIIRPIDLASPAALRAQFSEEVLQKALPQLRTYWSQRIFSGTGVPPPEVESPGAVIGYVLANKGAIGYLPTSASPGRCKVVSVR